MMRFDRVEVASLRQFFGESFSGAAVRPRAGDVELARVACPMPGIAGCLARLATWALMLDRNSCDTRFLSGHCRSSPMWVGEVVAGRVACWAAWIDVCLVQLAVRAPKP